MVGYTGVVTETLTRLFAFEAVPADWAVFSCQRLATAAEMADCDETCTECATKMTAKVGGGVVAGTMIGYRAGAAEAWAFVGPYCRKCEIDRSIADGC